MRLTFLRTRPFTARNRPSPYFKNLFVDKLLSRLDVIPYRIGDLRGKCRYSNHRCRRVSPAYASTCLVNARRCVSQGMVKAARTATLDWNDWNTVRNYSKRYKCSRSIAPLRKTLLETAKVGQKACRRVTIGTMARSKTRQHRRRISPRSRAGDKSTSKQDSP